MSCAQITAWKPGTTVVCVRRRNVSDEFATKLKPFNSISVRTQLLGVSSLKLKSSSFSNFTPLLKSRRLSPVCLAKTGGDNQDAPWKGLEKALGNLTRGQSIEDVLKQQMQNKDYNGDRDGSGGLPPGGSGGGAGGGGGSADGSIEPEDEGVLAEMVQAILATLGFIFVYIYILTGEELLKLFRDFIKYLFTGTESVRLKLAMEECDKFLKAAFPPKVEEDPYWLEKAILSTTTYYDSPEKDRRIYNALYAEQQKALASGKFDDDSKPEEESPESNSEFNDDSEQEEDY